MTQHPYLPQTPAQIEEMLRVIGAPSVEALFETIPAPLRLAQPPDLPPALSEVDLRAELDAILSDCRPDGSIEAGFPLGGGWEPHARPALVDRLATLPPFLTAYTPYQAEASQGLLQAFHEFQTMVARLLGCEIANASLYDGASALAEAAFMASEVTRGRRRVVVSATVPPHARAVLETFLRPADFDLVTVPHRGGVTDAARLGEALDATAAAVVLANPNFFGGLEDLRPVAALAHRHGALLIAFTEPILLGVLEPPGAMGADIVVAEGCSLGLTPYAGGDALGLFACREEYLRKVPGRLVGLTRDAQGRTAYTLTLQTREQHIRREKATSNICTNQGLNALRAMIHLAAVGPQGLREVGLAILGAAAAARRAAEALEHWDLPFAGPAAQSFVVRHRERGVAVDFERVGLPLERWYPDLADHYLVTADEMTTPEEIEEWVKYLRDPVTMEERSR